MLKLETVVLKHTFDVRIILSMMQQSNKMSNEISLESA